LLANDADIFGQRPGAFHAPSKVIDVMLEHLRLKNDAALSRVLPATGSRLVGCPGAT